MNSSKYRFTLDMHMAQSQVSLPVVLNDTARKFYISLADGGKIYHIADGCLALIRIKRPTGTRIEQFCPIEGNTNIVYDFMQYKHTAIVPGAHECEVTLYGPDGMVITTAKFSMVVSERVVNKDDVHLTDESWTAIDSIVAEEAKRQADFKQAIDDVKEAIAGIDDAIEEIVPPYVGENGNWFVHGEDTGTQAQGNPGVFLGSGEMPEGYNVQIDPEGSGLDNLVLSVNGAKPDKDGNVTVKVGGGIDADQLNTAVEEALQNAKDSGEFGGFDGKSVIAYGAKGDGSTDDTVAFQTALAENRAVVVPEGTYILSGTLMIEENCCLELSQATVLKFTQTSANCIGMKRLSNIKGNHATIIVPYGFTANVIDASTTNDNGTGNTDVPPFTKWDPQWKMSRYITDLNICKPDSRGFHYSVNGDCNGTAVYVNCNQGDTVGYMWGVNMSGLRIAGAFNYGIRLYNVGSGWNHDMRVEAVIDACKIGVSVENCDYARIAATIQPRQAYSMSEVYSSYAEYGIKLVNSHGVDLSSCRVWDWSKQNSTTQEYITLFRPNNQYQHVALFGDCRGLILDDYLYYAQGTYDIRELIYTDTQSNFDTMILLQEPFTRWFKVRDGVPYFSNGSVENKLLTPDDLDLYFDSDVIKNFTDVLVTATDNNGNVFNDVGFIKRGYYVVGASGEITENSYHGCTGYIPIKPGDTLYVHGITIPEKGDGQSVFVIYDANRSRIMSLTSDNDYFWNHGSYYFDHTPLDGGFKITVISNAGTANTAYIRFGFKTDWITGPLMAAINEEVKYVVDGFLADGIKVKYENIVGATAPIGDGASLAESDKAEMVDLVLAALPEWNGGSY